MRIEREIILRPEEADYIENILTTAPKSEEECLGKDETITHSNVW